MMTLRCTQKLLQRLRLPKTPEQDLSSSPTTRLGDWYATILFTRPSQIVVCMSECSRLCVILPARELSTLAPRFHSAVRELLPQIGISPEAAARELAEMTSLRFGPTLNTPTRRSCLGSLNDFCEMLQYRLEEGEMTLEEIALDLSLSPCSPMQWDSPRERTRKLLDER